MMNVFTHWKQLSFAHPWAFALLLLLPLVLWWRAVMRARLQPAIRLSTLGVLRAVPASARLRFRPLLTVLRVVCISALVVALARPRTSNVTETVDSEGMDIVISLDISGSMLAEDFQPNRIEAAKKLAANFIDGRQTDRIGLVIFSGESFTQCPVTIDHRVLKEQLEAVKSGQLLDGTAIGMGLATGVDRLRHTNGKSRILILLTDGVNNRGLVGPETALEIAKAYKVRVYTIGIGTNGQAPYPVPMPGGGTQTSMQPVQIDEPLLKKIALETGGNYYRATGNASLQNIYKEIDKLEKTKIEVNSYRDYAELFWPFALLAAVCLFLELLLRATLFRSMTA